jgi:hypothetical protein
LGSDIRGGKVIHKRSQRTIFEITVIYSRKPSTAFIDPYFFGLLGLFFLFPLSFVRLLFFNSFAHLISAPLLLSIFLMVLTDKQKHELHLAIFDYLSAESHGGAFANTVAAFQQDCGVAPEALATASGKGMLEKKWTSVIRLQKKVSYFIFMT